MSSSGLALCGIASGMVKRIYHDKSGKPCAVAIGDALYRGLGAPNRAGANLGVLWDARAGGYAVRVVFREEARPRRRFLVVVERKGSKR